MEPCCYPWIQSIIMAICSLVLIILGGVWWARENKFDESICSLLAIPLTLSQENMDVYITTNQTNQSLKYPNNFVLDLPSIQTDSSYSFHIIHNMFGYNISLSISGNGVIQYYYSNDFNTDKDNLTSVSFVSFAQQALDLSGVHISENFYKVWCPSSSLITNFSGIGQYCRRREYPLKIEGGFTVTEIGANIHLSAINNFVNFHNTSFIVSNYIDIPQAYFAVSFFVNSNSIGKKLCIAGIVIFFAMVIEFFIVTCYMLLAHIR